jgi:hypothetical protein
MITFIKWLEVVAAAPAATTSSSVSGGGATLTPDIAPFLRPVGSDLIRRFKKKKKR